MRPIRYVAEIQVHGALLSRSMVQQTRNARIYIDEEYENSNTNLGANIKYWKEYKDEFFQHQYNDEMLKKVM